MKHSDRYKISSLRLHEVMPIQPGVKVIRVIGGFIYVFYNKGDNPKAESKSPVFVPYDKTLESEFVIDDKCEYYNHGDNPKHEYKYPPDAGARCEFHHCFFRVIDGKMFPNCKECPVFKRKEDT